jgi:membrane protein implicated in regulation of membrane protease activity
MSPTLLWFIAFCVILGTEMILGTIYLLALAAGALCGALCTLVFPGSTAPFAFAAVVTALGVAIAYAMRHRLRKLGGSRSNETSYPDEGREISVGKVVDGQARVSYRGSTWNARAVAGEELKPGIWIIDRVDGTVLVLRKKQSKE